MASMPNLWRRDMKITQVETLSKLPKYETQAYTIDNKYTLDDVL